MFNKILVALNTNAIGQQIFEHALTLATASNAELLLLHVISPSDDGYLDASTMETYSVYDNVNYYVNQWESLKREGIEFLTLLNNQAIANGIASDFTQKIGEPSRTICEVARSSQADLIVLGRRGLSGMSEFFLGSVSNYVLHHAPCSVLTVQGVRANL
ncbi:universal stress protein [Nodularia spumigena CS-586/05]|uniref:universal stress protein n=1 Tax=Nodularia spumigena TaxID=70799 RepID=UPI00232EAD6C|nr:universal stress protein [Nodularia spumigena]MDB9345544.1 universal stress protein [Nodularia spumigena CS-588/06]MDB9368427.1 universal stress protein [Nodularia spumigena CS-586/05]